MGLHAGNAGWRLRRVLMCLGVAWLVSLPAFAQFDRGQISGVVKDETGGVVPGATVTATRYRRRRRARPSPTRAGSTRSRTCLPGRYDISAELQGFKKAVKEERSARRGRLA